ncbi:MAG: WbuC family cupin fold metalloprotein [Akkermansiaceae bacterium]
MSRALPNSTGPVVTLEAKTIAEGLAASRATDRKRMILPIQRTQEAQVQRIVNFLQPGTYIRPHCHPLPHATESVCLIQGALEILIFSEGGEVIARHHLRETGNRLIDLEPGTWHGMIVHGEDTVVFESKRGPYDAETDKIFAPWSPEEGDERVGEFLESLRA